MMNNLFVQCVDISAHLSVGDVVAVSTYYGTKPMIFNSKRKLESTAKEYTQPLKYVRQNAVTHAEYVRFFELEMSVK